MNYNVLIIGAGNIGALYDSPESEYVLTHAHAFSKTPGFSLVGFVDTDLERAQSAAKRWNTQAFTSIETAFAYAPIDIICVAVPDEFHYAVLRHVAQFPIKLVFAEKPLTQTLSEAEEIRTLYKKNNISLALNYIRRFVPEFSMLKNNIQMGKYGRFITGTAYYGKGFLHNGSHLLDTLRFLLGEIDRITINDQIADFYVDDPTVTAKLSFSGGAHFFLQAVPCNFYTIFELDFLFEKGRVRIVDSGFKIEEYAVRKDPIFNGYQDLALYAAFQTSLGMALRYAAKNIYDHLSHKTPLLCSLEDGYQLLALYARVEKEKVKVKNHEKNTAFLA